MIRVEQLRRDNVKRYAGFCRSVYSDCPPYRDSASALLPLVLNDNSEFGKRSDAIPLLALDSSGSPVAATVVCRAHADPDVLQLAFFEALPNQHDAVDALVNAARQQARKVGAGKIIAGLNGHVNYGLGFLANHYDSTPCFGSAYNPPYYIDYFAERSTSTTTLVSYVYDMHTSRFEKDRRLLDRVLSRFTFRTGNFKDLESEVRLYTRLNNECFAQHPLYARRSFEEDYELFKPFRTLLKEENLLVAEVGGEPVGFLLWYPDYNELVPPGRAVGLGTLLKLKLLRRSVSRFKIAEIGVLPQYQGTGAIVGLIKMCFDVAGHHHATCESGWVFDDNADSQSVCTRWQGMKYKTYKVFTLMP